MSPSFCATSRAASTPLLATSVSFIAVKVRACVACASASRLALAKVCAMLAAQTLASMW